MTEKKQKRKPRSYTDEFKQQLVLLYQNSKRKFSICREYDIAASLLDKWLKQAETSGSFLKKIIVQKNIRNSYNFANETANWKWRTTFYTKGGLCQTSSADFRTKVNVIKANAHKYSVSAMCKVLQIPRSTYYYEAKQKPVENSLAFEIREIFRKSRNNYGTRKIKVKLEKKDCCGQAFL